MIKDEKLKPLPPPENLIKELEQMQNKMNECAAQRDEYLAGWQRAKADYVNFKNEQRRFMEEFRKYAREDLLLELIKIMDSFDILIKHHQSDLDGSDWGKGVLQIKNQLENVLRSYGLEEIKDIDNKLNPQLHEVLETADIKEGEDEKIMEIMRRGWKFNGKIIRPIGVKVGKLI